MVTYIVTKVVCCHLGIQPACAFPVQPRVSNASIPATIVPKEPQSPGLLPATPCAAGPAPATPASFST